MNMRWSAFFALLVLALSTVTQTIQADPLPVVNNDNVLANTVIVEVTDDGGSIERGFGLIVGRDDNGRVFVVTARHLLQSPYNPDSLNDDIKLKVNNNQGIARHNAERVSLSGALEASANDMDIAILSFRPTSDSFAFSRRILAPKIPKVEEGKLLRLFGYFDVDTNQILGVGKSLFRVESVSLHSSVVDGSLTNTKRIVIRPSIPGDETEQGQSGSTVASDHGVIGLHIGGALRGEVVISIKFIEELMFGAQLPFDLVNVEANASSVWSPRAKAFGIVLGVLAVAAGAAALGGSDNGSGENAAASGASIVLTVPTP